MVPSSSSPCTIGRKTELTPSSDSNVPTRTNVSVPNSAPIGATTPPANAAPPRMTAATDSSVIDVDPVGSPPRVLAVTRMPARKANSPAKP